VPSPGTSDSHLATPSPRAPNYGLAAIGFTGFGVAYGLTIAATAIACSPGYCERFVGYSAVPVAGPLIEATAPGREEVYLPLQLAAFAVQLSGLTLGVVGLATTREVPEPSVASNARLVLSSWAGRHEVGFKLTILGL
jgi:hypothetical protein